MYFSVLAATLLALLPSTFAIPTPIELTALPFTPSVSKIQADLGSKLCKETSLYFPSSPEVGKYTERWSTEAEGDILVVVIPGCQKDVATVVRWTIMLSAMRHTLMFWQVKFANLVNLPFLAINRGHGIPSALSTIKHGILIRMTRLDSIEIAADAKTATMGGGIYVDQVLAKLAESNKVCGTSNIRLQV